MLRIEPPRPPAIIARAAACDTSSAVVRLRSRIRSHSACGYSSAGCSAVPAPPPMPFTRMSTRPKASRVCWTASSAAVLSAMSPATTSASPPAFSTALRASASRSSERPMIATFAPTPARAPQVRTPTPPEPPATIATRSASVKRCSSSMVRCLQKSADGGALGGELVPQRRGVERLDVVHHVALPDVDRAELVAEVDAGDRLLARPPLGDGLGHGAGPLEQYRPLRGEVRGGGDGAVPGDDGVDVEAGDHVQRTDPLVD